MYLLLEGTFQWAVFTLLSDISAIQILPTTLFENIQWIVAVFFSKLNFLINPFLFFFFQELDLVKAEVLKALWIILLLLRYLFSIFWFCFHPVTVFAKTWSQLAAAGCWAYPLLLALPVLRCAEKSVLPSPLTHTTCILLCIVRLTNTALSQCVCT